MAGDAQSCYMYHMTFRRYLACLWLAASMFAAAAEPSPAIQTALGQLGAEKHADRKAAVEQLIKFAKPDPPGLLKTCATAYRQATDPEVRWRLREVMEQVVDKHLFRLPRGFLGVQINNIIVGAGGKLVINGLEVPPRGIWVSAVVDGSGAAKSGMQANDVIVAVNDREWPGEGASGFIQHIQAHPPNTKLKLTVLRANETNELTATLSELPDTERERQYSDERAREFFANWWLTNVGEALPTE